MGELWLNVDNVIKTFVSESSNKSDILWQTPIFYSTFGFVLRGSKTIVSVPSVTVADDLKTKLQNRLAEKDLLIKDRKTKEKRPFKLLIKIIECPENGGQLILKKSEIPVTDHDVPGSLFFEIIEDERRDTLKNSLDENDRIEINETFDRIRKNLRSKIDENGKYTTHYKKPYAMSYRVTFNDAETERRQQTAVGDILIVINGSSVIEDQRLTKIRSDKFEIKNAEKYICTVGIFDIYAE